MSITPVSGPKMKAAGGLLVFEKVPDTLYPASKVVQELHDRLDGGDGVGRHATLDPQHWEQLQQEGLDYAASQIVSQSGIPSEVAPYAEQVAKEIAQQALDEMTENRGLTPNDPKGDWLIPWVLDPAVIKIRLKATGDVANSDNPLPKMHLHRTGNSVFFPGMVSIPTRFPSPPFGGSAAVSGHSDDAADQYHRAF